MSEEQANELLNETLEEIVNDATTNVLETLKEMEQVIFDKHGDPDTSGEVWVIVSTADRDNNDSFEEDRIELMLTGKGPDLYAGLQNKELAVVHSLMKGKIGTMVRSGAWMSPTGEHRPSEHPEKMSCIISCSFISNHIFFVVRFEDGTIEASSMNEVEYMEGRSGGQQRLVDALLDFEYLPTALHEHEYDEYTRIVEAIQARTQENETE